jgi:hypothetical protein
MPEIDGAKIELRPPVRGISIALVWQEIRNFAPGEPSNLANFQIATRAGG